MIALDLVLMELTLIANMHYERFGPETRNGASKKNWQRKEIHLAKLMQSARNAHAMRFADTLRHFRGVHTLKDKTKTKTAIPTM